MEREYSSAGRARPCQGRGHEFEPRYSLQLPTIMLKSTLRRNGRVAMQRIANPSTSVRLRVPPPYFVYTLNTCQSDLLHLN